MALTIPEDPYTVTAEPTFKLPLKVEAAPAMFAFPARYKSLNL